MSMRYPGGLIATSPVNAAYPSGVWTPSQSIPYQQQNVWTRDQYWPYTTLLLNGNGTNGAQNNTFLDSSTNNFTITRNGNTTQCSFTPYEANGYWSNYFDGTGDYLTVADAAGLEIGNEDFTIECWFYLTAGSNFQYFVSKGTNTDFVPYQLIIDNTNKPNFYASTNGSSFAASLVSSIAAQLNTWNHLAVCRVGSTVTMYLNGASVATGTVSGALFDNTRAVGVGGGSSGTNVVTGYLSNVRIVKGTAVYTAAFTPPTAPLTAISGTALLTCQSNRFIDNSTNAFAITVNGNTSVQAFQPFPGATTWSGSVLGGSGYFDGSGDYVALPNQSISLGSGACSVEFWCYITGEPTGNPFLFDNYGNSSARLFAYYDGNTMYLGADGTTRTTTFNYNSWNFFQLVRSGGTAGWYLNGTLIGSTFSSSGTIDLQRVTIGAAEESGTINPSQWTQGYITSFRASNTNRATTVPSSPFTSDGNTVVLLNFTNSGITDSAMMNNLETVGNAQVSTSVVKYGTGSMLFDGSGDYLVRPDAEFLRLSSGDFTIEAWVYLTGNQPQFDGGVASYGATTTSAGWTVAITGSSAGGTLNRLVYGVNASASGGAPLYGVNGIALNTWTHIAVTKSGTTVRLFINGSLDNSGTVTATPTTSTSYFFYVGTQAYDPTATTRQFAGYIDDFRLTKGYARYITNFTPPPARLPPQ